jgi:hypothetical protein
MAVQPFKIQDPLFYRGCLFPWLDPTSCQRAARTCRLWRDAERGMAANRIIDAGKIDPIEEFFPCARTRGMRIVGALTSDRVGAVLRRYPVFIDLDMGECRNVSPVIIRQVAHSLKDRAMERLVLARHITVIGLSPTDDLVALQGAVKDLFNGFDWSRLRVLDGGASTLIWQTDQTAAKFQSAQKLEEVHLDIGPYGSEQARPLRHFPTTVRRLSIPNKIHPEAFEALGQRVTANQFEALDLDLSHLAIRFDRGCSVAVACMNDLAPRTTYLRELKLQFAKGGSAILVQLKTALSTSRVLETIHFSNTRFTQQFIQLLQALQQIPTLRRLHVTGHGDQWIERRAILTLLEFPRHITVTSEHGISESFSNAVRIVPLLQSYFFRMVVNDAYNDRHDTLSAPDSPEKEQNLKLINYMSHQSILLDYAHHYPLRSFPDFSPDLTPVQLTQALDRFLHLPMN